MASLIFRLQHRHEGALGDLDRAHHLHALLAGPLFFQEFAFPGDVAAVALGGDVFAKGRDGGAGDDLAAHGPLDGDLELLFGDFILEAVADPDAPLPDPVLVDDHAQGVQFLAVHQDVEL